AASLRIRRALRYTMPAPDCVLIIRLARASNDADQEQLLPLRRRSAVPALDRSRAHRDASRAGQQGGLAAARRREARDPGAAQVRRRHHSCAHRAASHLARSRPNPVSAVRHGALAAPRRQHLAFPPVRAALGHTAARLADVLGAQFSGELVRLRDAAGLHRTERGGVGGLPGSARGLGRHAARRGADPRSRGPRASFHRSGRRAATHAAGETSQAAVRRMTMCDASGRADLPPSLGPATLTRSSQTDRLAVMPNASSARRLLAPAVLLVFGVAYSAAQWSMQPGKSKWTFVATRAGAKFEGAFEQFSADIHFDPDDPGAGRFDVVIGLSSVNSRDRERDEVIAGPDMLDAAQWPTARYVVQGFTAIGGGKYRGAGRLTLRNVTRETP